MCALLTGATSSIAAEDIQGFTEPNQDINVAAAETGIVERVHIREGDRVQSDQLLIQLDSSIHELTLKIAQSIRESRGTLRSVQEELDQQTRTVQKLRALQTRAHASPQEIERAESQQRLAQARLQEVKDQLEVKSLEFERARMQLRRRQVRSPIDGIVTLVLKDRGESVMANDPVLVQVVQLDPLLAVFLVPAQQARQLKPKQTKNCH